MVSLVKGSVIANQGFKGRGYQTLYCSLTAASLSTKK